MKTAQELFEISKSQTSKLVVQVLDGVKEHIIDRCEEEANKGSTQYSIYLKKQYAFVKDELLMKCINLANEFEDCGYLVSIDDSGNGYYIDFIMTFYWNGTIDYNTCRYGKNEHLYDTFYGKNK